jgi:DNA-binding NtrC family response regulator
MRKVFALLSRLESSLANVLVQGDSGTGKELVARAIHDHSLVSSGPFLAVNCGAMDRAFVRSELFGHKRGAFTGALDARVGVFEAASGGTLFLDEVGELPLDVQPVLLRTLEVGAITRMGENTERPVKVRIVAATHRDLRGEVEAGRFREDLYFRIMVVQIKVPSLRERPDDIGVLAAHFASQVGLRDLPAEVLAELASRSLPGNARELKNALHTYAALGVLPERRNSRDAELDNAFLSAVDLGKPYAQQKEQVLRRFLRVYLEALLSHTGGNQSSAAKISGLQRSYLNKVVQQLKTGNEFSSPDGDGDG